MSNKLVSKNNSLVLHKTNNECFYSCNGKLIVQNYPQRYEKLDSYA